MDLTGEGVGVYAEAKGEYTKQLCQYLLPALQQYFLDMLDDAKQKEANSNKILLMFQKLLEEVSDWNVDKVQRETSALTAATHCDYLEELLTAVFIAHTKVLSAIRLTSKQKKLQITIPRLEHFLHRTLTECSRLIWSSTYLFSTAAPSIERQKNLRQIETILHDGIQHAIRSMLPVKNILREYLKEDDDEEEEEKEKLEEPEEKVEEPEEKVEEPEEKVEEPEEKPKGKPEEKVEEKPEEKVEEKPEEKLEEKPEENPEEKPKEKPEEIQFTGLQTTPLEIIKETEDLFEPPEEEIKILEGSPEPLDGFEDLEKSNEILQMDFEELA
jgi:hypothetical protein